MKTEIHKTPPKEKGIMQTNALTYQQISRPERKSYHQLESQ